MNSSDPNSVIDGSSIVRLGGQNNGSPIQAQSQVLQNSRDVQPTSVSLGKPNKVKDEEIELDDKLGTTNKTDVGEESEQLECAICLQTCIHPVKLPCSHIFCFLCVKGIANQSKKCALCRQEIPPDFLKRPKLLRLNDLLNESSLKDGYQWFYEGSNGWWQYDERTSCELEDKHGQKATNFELLIAGFLYVIDLTHMIQYRRNDPTRRRRIKRDVSTAPKKGVAGLSIYKPKSTRKAADGGETDKSSQQNASQNNVPVSSSLVPPSPASPQTTGVLPNAVATASAIGGAVQRRQKVLPQPRPQSQSPPHAIDSNRSQTSPLSNTSAQIPRHSMVTRSAKNRSGGRQLPPPPPPPLYVQSYPPYMQDGSATSLSTVNVQPPSALPQQTISVNNQQCIAVMPQSSSHRDSTSPSVIHSAQGSANTRITRSRLSNYDYRNNNTVSDSPSTLQYPAYTVQSTPTGGTAPLDTNSISTDEVSPVTDQLENLSLQVSLSPRIHSGSSVRTRALRRRQPRARPRGQVDDDIDSPDSDSEW